MAEAEGLGRRAAEPRADRARAAGGLLGERRPQRKPLPLDPGLHDRPAVQRGRHAGLLPGRRRPRPHPPGPPVAAGPRHPGHLPASQHHRLERDQLPEPDPRRRPPSRGDAAPRLPADGPVALHGPVHAEPRFAETALRCDRRLQQQPRHRPGRGRPAGEELDAVGRRHPRRHHHDRDERGERAQRDREWHREPGPEALGCWPDRPPPPLPGGRPGGLPPLPSTSSGDASARARVPTRPTSAPSKTRTRPGTPSPTSPGSVGATRSRPASTTSTA